jgi:hypothetical protein
MRIAPASPSMRFSGNLEVANILRTQSNEQIMEALPLLAEEEHNTRIRRALKNFVTLQWYSQPNSYRDQRVDMEQALLKRREAGKIEDGQLRELAESGYAPLTGDMQRCFIDIFV